MRVWLDVNAAVSGSLAVAVPWFGSATVNVDHDTFRRDQALLLELEVTEAGEVTNAWLGVDGDDLAQIRLELAHALVGQDSPELRAALLMLRENRHTERAPRLLAVAGGAR